MWKTPRGRDQSFLICRFLVCVWSPFVTPLIKPRFRRLVLAVIALLWSGFGRELCGPGPLVLATRCSADETDEPVELDPPPATVPISSETIETALRALVGPSGFRPI